ncbi:hypothetical protein BUE80_DR008146 [Diplocarpon rosae]|nr:hypothetical protein BUE80_DR008146 [Diplocarpon rosae]
MSSLEITGKTEGIAGVEKRTSKRISAQNFIAETAHGLHFVPRDGTVPEHYGVKGGISGCDGELMRARATLTAEEEKKLLRKLDLYLLPLLSVMYAVKTIDAANVANARIMDQGTSRNIMTELHMSSDQYNLVTTMYYVRK